LEHGILLIFPAELTQLAQMFQQAILFLSPFQALIPVLQLPRKLPAVLCLFLFPEMETGQIFILDTLYFTISAGEFIMMIIIMEYGMDRQ